MYWVYKNFFFFQKNFFLLNNFNFFLFVKLNKNFKFINNYINYNNNFKNDSLVYFNKSNYLNNYFKYFNKLIIFRGLSHRNYQINFYGSYLKNNFYYFSNYNFKSYKKFINLLFQLNKENFNFIILDRSYKNSFPLINYIHNFKNLLVYKDYFFINTKVFAYRNWVYFYNKFRKKFKIALFIILDFYLFSKFFKVLRNLNVCISSLVPVSYDSMFVDYPLYITYYNFEKFFLLNLITQTVFISLNFKNYLNKLNYIKLFYNFYIKFNMN